MRVGGEKLGRQQQQRGSSACSAGRQADRSPASAYRQTADEAVRVWETRVLRKKPAIGQESSKILCHLQRIHDSFINAKRFEPDSLPHYCSFVPRQPHAMVNQQSAEVCPTLKWPGVWGLCPEPFRGSLLLNTSSSEFWVNTISAGADFLVLS